VNNKAITRTIYTLFYIERHSGDLWHFLEIISRRCRSCLPSRFGLIWIFIPSVSSQSQ